MAAAWFYQGKQKRSCLCTRSLFFLFAQLNIRRRRPNRARDDYTHGAEYWSERVAMMQTWADYLDELREAGKVIPLRRESR
jgi:hypothetical protein